MGHEALGLLLKGIYILKLRSLLSSSSFINILDRSLMLTSEKLTNNKTDLSQGNIPPPPVACREPACTEL